MDEPVIVINGVTLSIGQALAVRVAVSSFRMQMGQKDALGDDDSGRNIADGYRDRLTEVIKLMLEK